MPVRWMDEAPSTQELAHQMAEQGAPHGSAIAVRRQTAGRGTRGRTWFSPPGGLWMSIVCRPRDAAAADCLSIRVGLAVARAIEAACPGIPPLAIKWPNDLLLDGRKLGGVLCEARWNGGQLAWVVAGIGLNVHNPIPAAVAGTAIALGSVAPDADLPGLAESVAAQVSRDVRDGGFLTPEEIGQFAARDALLGRRLLEPEGAVAEGITAAGALRVRHPDGQVAETVGSVVAAGP